MNLILLGGVNWFYEIWNSLWLWVCSAIYYFIGLLYQVFEKVASVNLFTEEIFKKITSRMYLILGLAMLFILAYNIILAIINPDGKDKGTSQMTKVVKETIISLAMVVLLPVIFRDLYVFQTHVLESNIIGTIILGGVGSSGSSDVCAPTDYDCNCDFPSDAFSSYNNYDRWLIFFDDYSTNNITPLLEAKCKEYKAMKPAPKGAYMVAPSIFSSFYRPTQFDFEECSDHIMGYATSSVISGNPENEKICVNFFADVLLSKYTGNIAPFASDSYLTSIISNSEKNGVYMEFHWIMAIVAGVLALYMFFCYAMEIGVRVAKLGFLQIISPIPVMMRIIPGQKEKIYKKWFDNLKDTYIDVFIRLAIIYFALFGISLVPDVIGTMFNSVWHDETNFFIKLLVQVFVILGLLKFAQDAPKLFKEFFGGSGKFALKSPRKQLQENKLAMGTSGAIGGAFSTGIGNFGRTLKNKEGVGSAFKSSLGGFGAGMIRGAREGYKTNDVANLKQSVGRAKVESDQKYHRRRADIRKKNDYLEHRWGIDPETPFIGGLARNTLGNISMAKDNIVNAYERWGGDSAVHDTKRGAIQELLGYHKNLMTQIDKKGNIVPSEEARQDLKKKVATGEIKLDELVDRGFFEVVDGKYAAKKVMEFEKDANDKEIRKTYSEDELTISKIQSILHSSFAPEIDSGRAEALRNAKDSELSEWKTVAEYLTESMKNNAKYLDGFEGDGGFLKKIGNDYSDLPEEFKIAFSGSIEDFSKCLTSYLAKDNNFRGSNVELSKAFAVALDKIGSTANSDERVLSQKKPEKK